MSLLELVVDSETVGGRLATTAVLVLLGGLAALVLGRWLARRADDPYSRYYARKLTHYAVAAVVVIALAVVWRAFAGRVGVVIGLATAGVAFAMQEVIGAVAGWFNIVSGRIFRVGDRIEMGGVRGDVIDITPLRTKVMETGSGAGGDTWVRGRQYTGRVVAISNKATFTEPVFNFSDPFEYIWEELAFPVAYSDDWRRAEAILDEEARRVSAEGGAQAAIQQMAERYPVRRTEVQPRVYARSTDNYVELAVRFVVPVRTARSTKDDVTRRILDRFAASGIEVASASLDVNVQDR